MILWHQKILLRNRSGFLGCCEQTSAAMLKLLLRVLVKVLAMDAFLLTRHSHQILAQLVVIYLVVHMTITVLSDVWNSSALAEGWIEVSNFFDSELEGGKNPNVVTSGFAGILLLLRRRRLAK